MLALQSFQGPISESLSAERSTSMASNEKRRPTPTKGPNQPLLVLVVILGCNGSVSKLSMEINFLSI